MNLILNVRIVGFQPLAFKSSRVYEGTLREKKYERSVWVYPDFSLLLNCWKICWWKSLLEKTDLHRIENEKEKRKVFFLRPVSSHLRVTPLRFETPFFLTTTSICFLYTSSAFDWHCTDRFRLARLVNTFFSLSTTCNLFQDKTLGYVLSVKWARSFLFMTVSLKY